MARAGTSRWLAHKRKLLLHCVPDSILGAADNVLHLPCCLLRSPFGLSLGVASHLANTFFDGTFYLMSGALNAIFVLGLFSEVIFI
jgi:hypothetical protein